MEQPADPPILPQERGEMVSLLPAICDDQRAIIPTTASHAGGVIQAGEVVPDWEQDPDRTMPPGILFIPGSGLSLGTPGAPRVRRRWATQGMIVAIGGLFLAFLLLGVAPLAAAQGANSPFSVLARAVIITPTPTYLLYRVQSGDTFERIASRFGVTVGGLFEINHLYAGSEAQVGEVLRISTDPAYGARYTPIPQALPDPGVGTSNGGAGCLFCATAGWSNGAGHACAAEGTQARTDIASFQLISPENGTHWVRGFTPLHNGVDISTNMAGSPILAAQIGQVIFAGWDPYGFGWAVKINHCGGLATSYGHMERVLVHAGQVVTAGQTIGLQGSTGMATGIHLHFMTWWDNAPVDPLCAYSSLAGMVGVEHASWCPVAQAVPGR